MLDIGEQQLLMLLLVVQADGDGVAYRGGERPREQPLHVLIDVRAIAIDLGHRRARVQAARMRAAVAGRRCHSRN